MKNINTKKGFTIIEVVLVLAIAGLIFLMVFVALPNLQRSQRDTQRRNDYAALASNMVAYITNNGGSLPKLPTGTDQIDFDASVYLNEKGQDADTSYDYHLQVVAADSIDTVFASSLSGKARMTLDAPIDIPNENRGTGTVGSKELETQKVTEVYVVLNSDCSGAFDDGTSKPTKTADGDRHFVVYGALETGTYCQAE